MMPRPARPAAFPPSNGQHLNVVGLEAGDGFGGDAGVGDEDVDVGDGADEGRADHGDLAGIGHHDDLLGLPYHCAENGGLVGLDGGGPAKDIDAAGPDERLIEKDAAQHFHGGGTGERKSACPAHGSSGQGDIEGGLMVQLHSDIDGVGDDANSVAMTDASGDLRGGGAGGKADGLIFADKFGGGQADAALLLGETAFADLER